MRVIIALVVIIVAVALLWFFGAGAGYNQCVRDCQAQHCKSHLTPAMDCAGAGFPPCVEACREEHGVEDP